MRHFVIQYGYMGANYLSLKQDFPTITSPSIRSDNDLSFGDEAYFDLLKKSMPWRNFHNLIYSKEFWEDECKSFGITLNDIGPFRANFKEDRQGFPLQTTEKFTYARMDIGIGLEGYGKNNGGRGLHIDNPQRIISGLLYFTDQSEIIGGQFEICDKAGEIVHRVPISENMAIISLQNEDAWHRVNPMMSGKRLAVYFALNASWKYWDR